MGPAPIPERLEAQLRECVGRHGMDLEAVELTPAGRRRVLRVAVDQDGGVTLDDVADVTRSISADLDASDVMGAQPYTLEVTSRGTDRPLTHPRHWRRNADRLVSVTLTDGSAVEGRIGSSDDHGAAIVSDDGEQTIGYDEVRTARVQVELNRRDA